MYNDRDYKMTNANDGDAFATTSETTKTTRKNKSHMSFAKIQFMEAMCCWNKNLPSARSQSVWDVYT